jgi:CheY-like chemotaxis protein
MTDAPETRPVVILLVEDSPSDAALTIEALNTGKIANQLTHVEDGIEAMDYLRCRGKYTDAIKPDLIMLDLNLPRKDGREVLAELKNDPVLRAIPVIVLTTSNSDKDITQAYEFHANCYVRKPLEFAHFIEVVKSIEHFWLTIVTLPEKL